jgi:hypothetical protein
VPERRTLRIVAALLLVLVAIDLAAVHTCALDMTRASGRPHASTSISALDGPGSAPHQDSPLHPDHCFCHGLSVGVDFAALTEPCHQAGDVPDMPAGHLRTAPSTLYHPPQLPA